MPIDVNDILQKYHQLEPDLSDPSQQVVFGTSGHRGSSLHRSFNEAHILAITQAICDYRTQQGITGAVYLGKDTHALSDPAQLTALEVLVGNGVEAILQADNEVTPTPVISHAILKKNRNRTERMSDGIILTPSHNPPEDGGIKYNSTDGGPAKTSITDWIQTRANEILKDRNRPVKRVSVSNALGSSLTRSVDLLLPYVEDLGQVIDMDRIAESDITIGVNPLGGASTRYWDKIARRYGLNLTVVSHEVDPTFSFLPVDHDGKIRTDCSSAFVMADLIKIKDRFTVAFGNDADCDRHGIVTPSGGLMDPNQFLTVSIDYLLNHRSEWRSHAAIGKTMVSSSMIDRVVRKHGRKLFEVPVGFKWFAPGLFDGSICFGGEESAGASLLRRDGSVWTTDKDGFVMGLLAAEMTARTGRNPAELYRQLTLKLGAPIYTRIDTPATPQQKARLKAMTPESISETQLAGERISEILTHAPGNHEPLGGIKVIAASGWFAARPSGTENLCKLYVESFKDQASMKLLVEDAQRILKTFGAGNL
jgi:phosphoglucomutase